MSQRYTELTLVRCREAVGHSETQNCYPAQYWTDFAVLRLKRSAVYDSGLNRGFDKDPRPSIYSNVDV
jgi:hypothetical protein